MKKQISLILGILIVSISLQAQSKASKSKDIPTPEFKYQVMFVNDDNELSNLDKTGLSVHNTAKIIGVANLFSPPKVYLKADGCCASILHSGKPSDRYIMRIEPGMDPETMVELFKFEQVKDCRKLLTAKVTLGKAIKKDVSVKMEKFVLNFKRVSDGVYLITTQDQLAPGEYLFKIKSEYNNSTMSESVKGENQKGYCFSVKG